MKPTRVFLSVQPVGYKKPAGADPFTYRETRPSRWRASWWTRGTTTELYRGKPVATQDEAVRLALRWLERENKSRVGGPADAQLIDTTDQPERYGYSRGSAHAEKKKSPRQLDAEIAEALASSRAKGALSSADHKTLKTIVDRYDEEVRRERDPEFARRIAESGVDVSGLPYAVLFGLERDGLITMLWPVGGGGRGGRRWARPTTLGRSAIAEPT